MGQALLLGFLASFLGSIPLGTINVSVVDAAVTKGQKSAFYINVGAVLVEFFYTYIAFWLISAFVTADVLGFYFKLVIIPVFAGLFIYYFFKKSNQINISKGRFDNALLKGVMLGLVNPLSIPFWMTYISYFISEEWLQTNDESIFSFVLGVVLGSLLCYYLFALMASLVKQYIYKNSMLFNKAIGLLFLFLAIYNCYSLVPYFW